MVSSFSPDLSSLLENDHLTPVVPSLDGLASPTAAHEPLESLERYKLVGRLGHGGMAEVFLAAWEVAPFVHRPVVIKRLHTHFRDDQRLVQMFLDEGRLLCLLEHPHVVKTLEAGVIDGRCCIAMEYLEGQPLHRVLRRAYQLGKLPIEAAVGIAISVLSGLEYAHNAVDARGQSLEIVHRDISPQNVFVTNDGQVKVLDFGIAKAKTHEGRTATGVVKGKVGYIAPEQAADDLVDRRADIWSVGVVLWECLTGARLFKGETDAATLSHTLKGEIPMAASHRAELPVQLEAVLMRALQRAPAMRYASAKAMHKDLEAWQQSAAEPHSTRALGALMNELFQAEITEQRRMVSVLMARSDCSAPAPISNRVPSSTSALIVTNNAGTSTELSSMHERMNDLSRRHRRAVRAVALLFVLFAACAWGVVYFFVPQLNRSSANAGPTSAPTLATVHAAAPTQPSSSVATQVVDLDALPPLRKVASSASHPALHGAVASAPSPAHSALDAPAVSSQPDTAAPSFGFLTIDTSPWSQVSVGGRALGQTPLVNVKLPAGTQLLQLKNPELGLETNYSVSIEAGKTAVRRIGIE